MEELVVQTDRLRFDAPRAHGPRRRITAPMLVPWACCDRFLATLRARPPRTPRAVRPVARRA